MNIKEIFIQPIKGYGTSILNGNDKSLCVINELLITRKDTDDYISLLIETVSFIRDAIEEKCKREHSKPKQWVYDVHVDKSYFICPECHRHKFICEESIYHKFNYDFLKGRYQYCPSCGIKLDPPGEHE